MKRLFWLIVILIVVSACNSSRVLMDRAEGVMQCAPDSALTILQSIPEKSLIGSASKARYHLLSEIARDKNGLPLDSSLAVSVVRYYEEQGSADDQMKAWMYLGRYHRRKKNYEQAIICFSHAEERMNEAAENDYKGLVNSWLGELYRIQRDYATEIGYEERSVREFEAASDSVNLRISLAYLALANQRNQSWSASDSLYEQVLPTLSDDTLSYSVFLSFYAQSKVLRSESEADPSGAISLLRTKQELTDNKLSLTDMCVYALSSALLGDDATCDSIMHTIDQLDADVQKEAAYMKYRIARIRKDYREALGLLEDTYVQQDSLITQLLSESLTRGVKNHFEEESLRQQELLRRHRLLAILILSVLLLLAVGAYSILYFRKRRQIEEKDRMLRIAEETNRMLEQSLSQNDLRKRYAEVYKKQYQAVGALCDSYFSRSEGIDNKKELVYTKVSNLLAYISEDESLHARFEEQVNQEMDGIMEHLRTDLGGLSPVDARTLCYHLVGFSTVTIATILATSPSAVYTRLSRIRDRISKSNSVNKEHYLAII